MRMSACRSACHRNNFSKIARVGRVDEDPRQDVRVGVGVVEFQLKRAATCTVIANVQRELDEIQARQQLTVVWATLWQHYPCRNDLIHTISSEYRTTSGLAMWRSGRINKVAILVEINCRFCTTYLSPLPLLICFSVTYLLLSSLYILCSG